MNILSLNRQLRFYFITDDGACDLSPVDQVKIALQAGATMIQYRNKSFSAQYIKEAQKIRDLCKCNQIPFIINDNILLAKAVGADGVHLGQDDNDPALARRILGLQAVVGLSVSSMSELEQSDLSSCDYLGVGPVFPTGTKTDAKNVIYLEGLNAMVKASSLPVVAIGGIDDKNAASCFENGAAGIAVISVISRAKEPELNARFLSMACGCTPDILLSLPWNDEFALIRKLIKGSGANKYVKIPPGDDCALLESINRPVVTTDTQKEGVHFRLDWQTPEEVGKKAVEITFSDLAASYASPVSLFVNLALPCYMSDSTVEALYSGIMKTLSKYGCFLGGGNISAGDVLSLDLFAIGDGHKDIFPSRSNGRPGHGLYCTGPVGLARGGLKAFIKKDTAFPKIIHAFKAPVARFDASRILAAKGVNCVIDISDGLAGDATHIAKASGISMEFTLNIKNIDPELILFCEKYRLDPVETALAGGEDYELLFTCRPKTFEMIKKDLPKAFQAGRCLPFTGKHLVNPPKKTTSFQHGKK